MADASTTERFPCTPEQFYSVISDFARYPEFLTEVKSCRVVEEQAGEKIVEFEVSLIKSFTYRIRVKEEPGRRLSWHFDSGDVFKTNDGSWDLSGNDGQTKAVYRVEATFKLFVPGPVAKALVSVNLPNMMRAYQNRVRALFGEKGN